VSTAPTVPTVSRRTYGPLLKAADAAAKIGEKLGVKLGSYDLEHILATARARTGLTDFGPETFREPMQKIIDTAGAMPFTSLGRVVTAQSFTKAAANRLHYEKFVVDHPEVRDIKVERPIFVLGFPRTGTTVLQNLLALHPERRGLQFWELIEPTPTHDDFAIDRAKRMANLDRILKLAYLVAPEQRDVHYVDTSTLEECWPLFGNSFAVLNWDLQCGNKAYGDWLVDEYDMHAAYAEYRQWLQVALWRQPAANLVTKCPEHLWFVDALLDTFPDACIVWTHRDPVDTIASYCSLISMQWRTLLGGFEPKDIGDHVSRRFHQGIERAMEARQRHDPKRFYDLEFSRFVRDPAAAVRDVCRHFDLSYGKGMDGEVANWLATKRSDERGAHKYDAEMYGLRKGDILDQYSGYIENFEVKVRAA